MKDFQMRGVVPTMITPYDDRGNIAYDVVDRMVEWYIERGVGGLFAVCLSSECFHLSLRERVMLTQRVVEAAKGRVPVVASGHVSYDLADQADELKRVADAGADAVVLIVNRLAMPAEGEEAVLRSVEALLDALPAGVPLGLYESPYPYHRLLTPQTLRACAQTGRFAFMKDTCCDPQGLADKLAAIRGTRLQLFNANTATLLESLRQGAAGFSGIMANLHPGLYADLCDSFAADAARADRLQDALGLGGLLGYQLYPANAKYHFTLEGIAMRLYCRSNPGTLTAAQKLEVGQARRALARIAETTA